MIDYILKALHIQNITELKHLMQADAQEIFKGGPKQKVFVANNIRFVYNETGFRNSIRHKYLINLKNGLDILL
jgi:hypothetical protein